MRKLLVLVLPALVFCMTVVRLSPASASVDDLTGQELAERLALRDAGRYAQALDRFAAAMEARVVCPVPDTTGFVDSFGAPRAGHSHLGVDVMAPELSPIYAPQSGYFRNHGSESWYLDANDGALWFGTHDHHSARPDGPVDAGDLIAYVGHTGNAQAGADHLHGQYASDGVNWENPYPIFAAACLGAPAPTTEAAVTDAPSERSYYEAPAPTFVYQTAEVQRWFNSTRPLAERIGRGEAIVLRRFLNAVTWQRVVAYVRAMTPDCRPGAPDACASLIRQVFARYGLDGNAAVSVASCESTLDPSATNGTHDGLFQQAREYWASRAASYGVGGRSAFDPEANAIVSARMVQGSGWSAWSCRP